MEYRADRYGNQLSALGFGCMRFQKGVTGIDMEQTEQQIMAAIEGGVNYFDTAYIYPGSESAIGEIFEKNGVRDKVHIATKLPHYLIRSRQQLDKLFDEELRRLRTDYVDYYLMHMLADVDTWQRLCDLGIREWIEGKKASGQIRQIGFSYHGNSDMFCRLVDAYDWDFCQIQYNYMDEHSQAGRRGLRHAHQKGLAVIIMEPLRGGKLVNRLPRTAQEIFDAHPARYTPAQWALKWLWNQPEVTVVLSGMNTLDMVQENVRTAATTRVGELGADEDAMLQRVVAAINAGMKVGCTGCGYCMPCPKQVDIPGTFAAWNRRSAEGKAAAFFDYMMCTALRKTPTSASNCVGCGKCEQHCPQHLPIRRHLQEAKKELEGPLYRVVRRVVSWFVHF